MEQIRRSYETCNLLALMADRMAVSGTRITPRQIAAFDCWHRLFGYPADRRREMPELPTFAELLAAATEEIAPTGRPVTARAREALRLGQETLLDLLAQPER